MKAKYYVMRQDESSVGGYRTLSITTRRREADRIAKGHTTFCNGKPWHIPVVWTEEEYIRWHENEIMPYYREAR